MTNPDTLRLEPCPFCGGEPKLIEPTCSAPYVICTRCHAGGPVGRTATSNEACETWNRRAAPASPLGEGDWINGLPDVPVGSPTWCAWATHEIMNLRAKTLAAPAPLGEVRELADELVQLLAPDQGESCTTAFGLAVKLQAALPAAPIGAK